MTAEMLGMAVVVLLGATVWSMIRNFLREPWYLEESVVLVESPDQIVYTQRPAVASVAPRGALVPVNVHALPMAATPVERPTWLDSTQPFNPVKPESVPA